MEILKMLLHFMTKPSVSWRKLFFVISHYSITILLFTLFPYLEENDSNRKGLIGEKVNEYKSRSEQLKKRALTQRIAKLAIPTLPSVKSSVLLLLLLLLLLLPSV